ncbi:MAG: nitrogenase component 1 [Oscillospiraceae bacterium]|jgi:nitrogenase molybdenum-iron protein alpha/beta subunit|nr:nitrogenase component 1 [Oscillospiraceae bacterium]
MMTKHFPTPSDRMGFLWTLTSIEDCYVIEFGPAGTTHFALEGAMELGGEHKMNVFTTHMSEVDITFGKHDKLAGAIREVDAEHRPKYIFVMASSISSLIGIDIDSICFELQDEIAATLIPVTYGGYDGDYNLGIERALLTLCKTMVQDAKQDQGLYNIIGSNIDSYNFLSDKTEIKGILADAFGLKLNTCFTAYTSVAEIERAAKAGYNIVLRAEGLKAAEWMKTKFGIPFVYQKPYGITGTLAWLKKTAETFDLKVDMGCVTEKTEEVRRHLSEFKMFIRNAAHKNAVIYADYDTAAGLADLLAELGLSCSHVFSKHALPARAKEFVKAKPAESELKEALGGGYYAAFGDDTLRKLCSDESFFQVANPNMDKYNFYPHTPFVGFNGVLRLLQDLMNFERKKLKNK